MASKKDIIAVVGLGYVGLPIAIEFGKLFKTIGYDVSKKKINNYKKGNDVNKEIDKKSFLRSKLLSFTSSQRHLSKANIIIITVPTPIDKVRKPDLSYLSSSSITVAKNMSKGAIIIYESTVYPGVTEDICVPIIEKHSGLKWKKDFFVGYSPERINPGDKKRSLTNITKVVSGDSQETLNKISQVYTKIIKAGIYKAQSIKVAEAAKVIENTQRDINIALMNELSLIFNKMNINTSEVLKAANTKWNFQGFKPGLVGGHCIGVDPYYLVHKASELGIHTEVIQSGRKINDYMPRYVSDLVTKSLVKRNLRLSNSNIIILGLTFKENVSDIRNSKMIEIYKNLRSYNVNIFVYDPHVNKDELFEKFNIKMTKWEDMPTNTDGIIYGVSHKEFRNIKLSYFKSRLNKGATIYDIQSNININLAHKAGLNIWQL